MKTVLSYEMAPGGMEKVKFLYPAHRERLDEFHARGVLPMVGPFADPTQGSLAIFTSREAAEEFVNGDPFVINGLVGRWTLKEWNEVFA